MNAFVFHGKDLAGTAAEMCRKDQGGIRKKAHIISDRKNRLKIKITGKISAKKSP